MENLFRRTLVNVPNEIRTWVAKSYAISNQILDILKRKKMTLKEFADGLGESEEEVNDWIMGTYNFTEEIIAKIELALGEPVTITINQAEEKYGGLLKKIAEKDNQIHRLEEILKQKGIEPGEYSYAMSA